MRPTAQRGPGGHPDSRTPPARNRGCHLSGCPGKPYRRLVHRPRVDQHTPLVVTTSRNSLPIAWATHPVPVIDTRPTGLVLADDAVCVVVAHLVGVHVGSDGSRRRMSHRDHSGGEQINHWLVSSHWVAREMSHACRDF